MNDLRELFVYLAASPLTGLTATMAAFLAGQWAHRASGGQPIVNPVLIAIVLLVAALFATGIDYRVYFAGAQFVHFLLGPATVALAVPLYRQRPTVRRAAPAIFIGVIFGTIVATVSAIGIAWALGASRTTLLSLAPKSVTAPVAMGIAEQIGGLPALTAVLVVSTGILGAVIATNLLNLAGLKDYRARGLAVGIVAHGIGVARAFQVGEVAGVFASIGMGLAALFAALALPFVLPLFL